VFLEEWLSLRSIYAEEILGLEAPSPSTTCQGCHKTEFKFRCRDCFYRPLTCKACCAKGHANTPFHSVELWNGMCFLPSDLAQTGLAICLGHKGSPCPEYQDRGEDENEDQFSSNEGDVDSESCHARQLQIIHSNGVCERTIQYCKCANAPAYHIQLLQHHLFPASSKRPQTAFTFQVLDHFHIDAMECKTSAGAFYAKLKRLTSNAFPDTIPVRPIHTFLDFAYSLSWIAIIRIGTES
jgi:hypothetical protein